MFTCKEVLIPKFHVLKPVSHVLRIRIVDSWRHSQCLILLVRWDLEVMEQNEARPSGRMAAADGPATGSEESHLCFNEGHEASGNPVSLNNEQEQAVVSYDRMTHHSAQLHQQTISQERHDDVTETQEPAFAAQGAQTDLRCNFCSTIVAQFNAVGSNGGGDNPIVIYLGQVRDQLSGNCPHTTWLQSDKYFSRPIPLYETRPIWLAQGRPDRTQATLRVGYETNTGRHSVPTLPFELICRPEVPGHRGRGRVSDENWINIEQVKDWRSRCIAEHGSRCDKPGFGVVALFRPSWLIDVVQGCIVPCENGDPRFLTLSYTWGKAKSFLTKKHNINDVRRPGALLYGRIAANIPETIRNAIALTKALGETQLWVDSLCIVQDDEVALQRDLRNMHRIYASSFLTIIAEDGQDAEFGLRGLRGISAARVADQEILHMAAGERLLMTEIKSLKHQVSAFDYHERMWTFQERIFATRRLIFTTFGSVRWECNCVEWNEHLRYYADGEKSRDDELASGLKSSVPSLGTLVPVVREFNGKNLTFDEDVSRAFSGIQTHFNGLFPSGLFFGHPEFFFDISLCWFTWKNLRRRTVSEKFTGDSMHSGLPSWSWMGWQGRTLLPRDAEHHRDDNFGFTKSVTKWYCTELPSLSPPRPIDTRWHSVRAAALERQVDMDGWICLKVEPPQRWSGFDRANLHLMPHLMPKRLPRRMYRRRGLEDADSTEVFWYPVPPISGDVKTAEDGPYKPERCQFIRCVTTRAFLTGSMEFPLDTLDDDALNPMQPLNDDRGNVVGALMLHEREDHLLLKGGRRVELVAVVKGWTSLLNINQWWAKECHMPANDDEDVADEDAEVDVNPTALKEEDDKDACSYESHESQGRPWISEWQQARQCKRDCVFVLWIIWEHGIAYRKAFGFVIAERWEELKEHREIDLILG